MILGEQLMAVLVSDIDASGISFPGNTIPHSATPFSATSFLNSWLQDETVGNPLWHVFISFVIQSVSFRFADTHVSVLKVDPFFNTQCLISVVAPKHRLR
jgi:hypothetical protein